MFGANIVSNTYEDGKGMITFDSDVVSIGAYAFYNCTSLTSINIPESVTSLGEFSFDSCSSLTSITIPDGVTEILNAAFMYCTSLRSVTIGSGVTKSWSSVFYYCSSLETLYIYAITPPILMYKIFNPQIPKIYVPSESVNLYKSSSWSLYSDYIFAME